MKIKISLYGFGSEYGAGYIPEKIWKYIKDECEEDASVYHEKLDDGEVPEEFKLAESISEYYDADCFFEGHSPYSNVNLTVYDENDKEIAGISLKDEEIDTTIDRTKPEANKHYFVWESVEKGTWSVGNGYDELIEIDGEFDVNKLKIHLEKLTYDNDCKTLEFISAIEYDEEIYDIDISCTNGKGFECDFYEDYKQD